MLHDGSGRDNIAARLVGSFDVKKGDQIYNESDRGKQNIGWIALYIHTK